MKLHVYLISTQDNKNSFVFTNIEKAKQKQKEINGIVFEWMDLWCRPLGKNSEFDDSSLPWELLKLAYKQGNWNIKVKYCEELFNSVIERISNS